MLENHQKLTETLSDGWHTQVDDNVNVAGSLRSLLFEVIVQIRSQQIPIKKAGNYFYSNWMPTDSPGLYAENLNDEARRAWLHGLGWIDRTITYRINQFGFRCDDFSDSDTKHRGIVVLGCSYTQGTGLPEEEVYTHHLQTHFGRKVWNLGIPGADTKPLANFALFHMLDYIEPEAIIFTIPPNGRYKSLRDFPPCELENVPELDGIDIGKKYNRTQITDLTETTMNYVRDMMSVKALCADLGIPFVASTANNLSDIHDRETAKRLDYDRARDLMHFGVKHHRRWADKYIRELEPHLR